jgi:hypothetical protein
MKTKLLILSVYLLCFMAACQPANPLIETPVNREFTLARDQSAAIKGTNLILTFNSVLSDDRCPIDVECVASGPVTISLSAQEEGAVPSGITLEAFTDQEGRSPGGEFDGIQDSAEIGDYTVRLVGVLPYPRNLSGIKASDYQVTLVVSPD